MDDSNLVREGYNFMADVYLKWINGRPTLHKEKLEDVLARLPPSAKILELGCGAGVPVTKTLVERGYNIVANDISEKQIELAKQHVPGPRYILGDMTQLDLEKGSFDAAIAFYTIFHIPRKQHQALFENVHSFLKPGGLFLATLYVPDEESSYMSFMGAKTFFSGHGTVESVKLLKKTGFEMITDEVRAQGDVDDKDDPDNGVSFHWVLAKKTSAV